MVQPLELATDFLVGEAAGVHLQNVASSCDGLMDRGGIGIESRRGNGEFRQAVQAGSSSFAILKSSSLGVPSAITRMLEGFRWRCTIRF